MDNSQIMGMIAVIVSVGSVIITIINHKRIRSNCCGKKIEVSVDIEQTTPPPIKK